MAGFRDQRKSSKKDSEADEDTSPTSPSTAYFAQYMSSLLTAGHPDDQEELEDRSHNGLAHPQRAANEAPYLLKKGEKKDAQMDEDVAVDQLEHSIRTLGQSLTSNTYGPQQQAVYHPEFPGLQANNPPIIHPTQARESQPSPHRENNLARLQSNCSTAPYPNAVGSALRGTQYQQGNAYQQLQTSRQPPLSPQAPVQGSLLPLLWGAQPQPRYYNVRSHDTSQHTTSLNQRPPLVSSQSTQIPDISWQQSSKGTTITTSSADQRGVRMIRPADPNEGLALHHEGPAAVPSRGSNSAGPTNLLHPRDIDRQDHRPDPVLEMWTLPRAAKNGSTHSSLGALRIPITLAA